MAEFCKKCFDKHFGDMVKDNEKVVMSKNKEICEGCSECDHTVDLVKEKGFFDSIVEFVKGFEL